MSVNESERLYFVSYESSLVRLDPRYIVYLKANGSYCKIHLGEKVIELASNLSHVYAKLVGEEFLIRVDRSHVVNVRHIARIMGNMLLMSNGDSLTVAAPAIEKIKNMICIIK